MTIVRQLVTQLSFAFDRTNLDRFERAISGFKVRFGLAATAFGYVVNKILGYFKDIADESVRIKDVSDLSGIALKDFVQLQKAAQAFHIPVESFQGTIRTITTGLREARQGFGELFNVARESRGLINFRDIAGNAKNAKDVILDLATALRKVPDISDKLFILERFPGIGAEQAANWLRFLSQTDDEIAAILNKQEAFAQNFVDNISGAQQFRQELQFMEQEFSKLAQSAARLLFPLLGRGAAGLNVLIEGVQKEGFLNTANFLAEAVGKTIQNVLTGKNDLTNLLEKTKEDDKAFYHRVAESEASRINNAIQNAVTNNVNFEFNVPPGTTQEQANVMTDQMKFAFDLYFYEKNREVISNNPAVE